MKYTYYGETRCSVCGVVSRNQPKGDGCHNAKTNDEERLLNAELLVDHWQGRYYAQEGMTTKYMELMDASAKELDKAFELLRWAETEMRYAKWYVRAEDNHGRTDVYEAIKEFLK